MLYRIAQKSRRTGAFIGYVPKRRQTRDPLTFLDKAAAQAHAEHMTATSTRFDYEVEPDSAVAA